MRHAVIAIVLVAVALTGCSSGPKGDGRECLDVPDETMQMIAEGANDMPITPVNAAAVQSKNSDLYLVAMSFTAPGFEDEPETGVWFVGSVDPPEGPIAAVDAFAAEFTDWPNEVNGTEFNQATDGVDEAEDCLADTE